MVTPTNKAESMGEVEGEMVSSVAESGGTAQAPKSDGPSLLERAIWIAAEAHSGQIDKAGAPYIAHVRRVCQAVSEPDDRIVAALHDVMEDCPQWDEMDLREAGFPGHVVEAVKALTRKDHEPYMAFIERVALNPIAVRVKLADLADNSDLSRLSHIGPSDRNRVKKYALAIERLSSEAQSISPSAASAVAPATDEPPSPPTGRALLKEQN